MPLKPGERFEDILASCFEMTLVYILMFWYCLGIQDTSGKSVFKPRGL